MPQVDSWERFLSNNDNKNKLIVSFFKFLKSPISEEYRKYIVWYAIIYIRDYVPTFEYFHKV